MKNILPILLFSTCVSISFAQDIDFAPIGAKWHYSEEIFVSFPVKTIPRTIEVTGEALIGGRMCRKIEGIPPECTLPEPCFVYSSHDSVFYWSTFANQFCLLYDFGAMPGEGWVFKGLDPVQDSFFVRVDSISYRIIAQDTLRVMHTTYEIIPGIPYFGSATLSNASGAPAF
jgi:hypothetical protein